MRSVKHGKKRSRRINYNRNAKVAKNKAVKKRKAMQGLHCKTMRSEWDRNSTVKRNIRAMGIAYDPNKAVKMPSNNNGFHDEMEIDEPQVIVDKSKTMESVLEAEVSKLSKVERLNMTNADPKSKSGIDPEKAARVISTLEKEAKEEEERMKGRRFRLLPQDIEFCVYMMEKHGEDYEEMSRDPKNMFQDTPKQIQRKLRIFKECPEFEKYQKMKSEMQ